MRFAPTALTSAVAGLLATAPVPVFSRPATPPSYDFHAAYHGVHDVSHFLHAIAANHSSYATVHQVGTTYERRPIEALYISSSSSVSSGPPTDAIFPLDPYDSRQQQQHLLVGLPHTQLKPKPRILINAGTHAREWVGPAAALYTIDNLLTMIEAGGEPSATATHPTKHEDPTSRKERHVFQHILRTFDLIFVPILNPDGYAYSWEHKRLWRRNRQPLRDGCQGIDINLNFDYEFSGGPDQSGCTEF